MRYIELSDRLTILADNQDRAYLAEAYRERGYRGADDLMAEAFNGSNGGVSFILPIYIPEATTDMPMVADWAIDDDGNTVIYGKVYGFPDYCVTDPWAELRNKGRVSFVTVADYGEQGAVLPPVDSEAWRAVNAESFERCLTTWAPSYPAPRVEADS